MTRIAERVRCIVCTHVTTEYPLADCSYTGCPHRGRLADACTRYEQQVLEPLRQRIVELVEQHVQDEK